MKDNDILLYGGIALAAYFLFIKKPATAAPVTTSLIPGSSTALLTNSAVNPANPFTALTAAVTKLINPAAAAIAPTANSAPIQTSATQSQANADAVQQSVDNLFGTVPAVAPAASAPLQPVTTISPSAPNSAYNFLAPSTPLLPTPAPQAAITTDPSVYVNTDDSELLMMENNDFPGAMAGLHYRKAAMLGEY